MIYPRQQRQVRRIFGSYRAMISLEVRCGCFGEACFLEKKSAFALNLRIATSADVRPMFRGYSWYPSRLVVRVAL